MNTAVPSPTFSSRTQGPKGLKCTATDQPTCTQSGCAQNAHNTYNLGCSYIACSMMLVPTWDHLQASHRNHGRQHCIELQQVIDWSLLLCHSRLQAARLCSPKNQCSNFSNFKIKEQQFLLYPHALINLPRAPAIFVCILIKRPSLMFQVIALAEQAIRHHSALICRSPGDFWRLRWLAF